VEITAIPYYAWDNRKPGPMKVWLPQTPRTPALGGLETQAKVSMSYVSGNSQPWGINDGLEPKSSGEQPPRSVTGGRTGVAMNGSEPPIRL
jgi:uncharacterized protein